MINIVPFSFYYFLHMAQKEKKWTAPDREAGECTTYGRLRSNPTKHEYSILMYDPPARLQVHTKRPIGCILTGQARIPMRALTHIASFVETWIRTNHRHACHAHPGPPTDAACIRRHRWRLRTHQQHAVAHPSRGRRQHRPVNLYQRWTLSVCVCIIRISFRMFYIYRVLQ